MGRKSEKLKGKERKMRFLKGIGSSQTQLNHIYVLDYDKLLNSISKGFIMTINTTSGNRGTFSKKGRWENNFTFSQTL